jgi:hypothetical protein
MLAIYGITRYDLLFGVGHNALLLGARMKTKPDSAQMVSAKMSREVIDEFSRQAAQFATSRSALIVEAMEAYLPVLRSGRRTLRDMRSQGE